MPTNKIRIPSAAMAGGLVFTGVTAVAIAHTGHAPTRTALAADTNSSPTVNLDNCPILAEGYHGGCVNQLPTELNTILGLNLPVDGTFGLATKAAVETFQQEHNIAPVDGIVGPQTKAALDNPGSSSAGTPPGQLSPGQQITSGTQIASPDGKFVLQMQSDGNLVLRAPGNIPLGDTRTRRARRHHCDDAGGRQLRAHSPGQHPRLVFRYRWPSGHSLAGARRWQCRALCAGSSGSARAFSRPSGGGPRSPAKAVRLELKAGVRGEVVGDGAGVAGHDGRGGVDLLDEQRQGAGDAGGGGPFELDGDRGGGVGDGAGQAADDGFAGDGAVFVVVAQVGVEVVR